uniref:Single domain-containing protein n=1 Tax=Amblyomma triste TaxID=251400 RepID=A0A023GCK1_AMBTT
MPDFTTRSLLIALSLVAAIVLGEDSKMPGLTFLDGACIYRNTTLQEGQKVQHSEPCEEWTCNAGNKALEILGCTIPPVLGCISRSKNALSWPYCCNYQGC